MVDRSSSSHQMDRVYCANQAIVTTPVDFVRTVCYQFRTFDYNNNELRRFACYVRAVYFFFLELLSPDHIGNQISVHTITHMPDHQLTIKTTKRYVTMPSASTVKQLLRGAGDGSRQVRDNKVQTPHAT